MCLRSVCVLLLFLTHNCTEYTIFFYLLTLSEIINVNLRNVKCPNNKFKIHLLKIFITSQYVYGYS